MKRSRIALYEFMPYGAPELLEDGDKNLTRAMATSMTGMLALLALELLSSRKVGKPKPVALALGCLGAAGSIEGLWALGHCAALPAAFVFPGSGIAAILSASLVSVFAMGEKRTGVWYGTVGLAVLSIILVSIRW